MYTPLSFVFGNTRHEGRLGFEKRTNVKLQLESPAVLNKPHGAVIGDEGQISHVSQWKIMLVKI